MHLESLSNLHHLPFDRQITESGMCIFPKCQYFSSGANQNDTYRIVDFTHIHHFKDDGCLLKRNDNGVGFTVHSSLMSSFKAFTSSSTWEIFIKQKLKGNLASDCA